MDGTEQGATDASGRPLGAISTLVSLFLLLLVFFIVLFSVASVQKSRAHDVLASLDRAFGHLPASLGLIAPDDPAPLEDQSVKVFIDTVSQVLTGALPVGLTDDFTARGGTLLVVSLPPDGLFEAGGAKIIAARRAELDRLAVLLQRRATEAGRFHLTVKAILPVKSVPGDAVEGLMINRLGAFADYLYRRGCPPDGVSIMLDHGSGVGLRLEFSPQENPADP